LKAIGGRLPMAWWHRCWLYRGIQHFNAIGSVESLDVGVQSRTTWPDEIPDDVVGVGPRLHDMASEFRAIVTANRCRLAVPFAKLLENPHHAAATDAEVDLDGQHFTCEVIDHVEGSERTTIGQRVVHEVHRPANVRLDRLHERMTLAFYGSTPPTPAQRQALLAIQPPCSLVVDDMALLSQLAMQLRTSPGRVCFGQLH